MFVLSVYIEIKRIQQKINELVLATDSIINFYLDHPVYSMQYTNVNTSNHLHIYLFIYIPTHLNIFLATYYIGVQHII